MYPQIVKYRLWNLALRMNPQAAVYGVRTVATAPGEADTFTDYNLLRVTYRELTNDELIIASLDVSDQAKMWTIYQVDLDLSGAPVPAISYELTFADGTKWIIERVKTV